MSLLETIQSILKCEFLSDLRYEPYNKMAKEILKNINLKCYSSRDIYSTFEYLFSKKGE